MALVDDDEVKVVRRILFVQAGTALIFCNRLISGEVDFTSFDCIPVFDLLAGITKDGKGLVFWVVHQDIAVG